MQTRLVPYVPFAGKLAPLPDALELQVVAPLGELSTASVHYSRAGLNAGQLDGVTELGFEYYNGSGWVEPPNCRFLSMKGGFDHLEAVPTRKYELVGIGWLLRLAKVWDAAGLPVDKDGKVQFLSATAGGIMATLISNAQSRGWGAGVTVDFSATVDSSGAAWSKVLTIAYDLDLDLEAVLANLYEQGVCDFRWEGRTLRVFNPDAAMAADRTVGAAPVRLLVRDGQTSAPEDWTHEDLITDAMVLGDDGARWEFTNGANNPLGRLERVIKQGGVADSGTASLLADADLLAGIEARVSYTREFVLTAEAAVWPFRDYGVGDWVFGQRGTGFERLRVRSLSLTVNEQGVKGHAVLGDRLEDLLTKLAKRTKGITGGASAGGTGARPAPEGVDARVPAAPSGLVVGVESYLDDRGEPRGRVSVSWAHSGKATNGTVMDVDRFQVYYRVNATGEVWRELGATQEGSLDYSPLPVFKADGVTAEAFGFKVRAVADNGRASAFSPVVAVTMEDDLTAPPAPEFLAADLKVWLRSATVRWRGKGKTGSTVLDMPRDFDHINVWQGSSATGPWTLVGSLFGAHELWASDTLALGTVWFSLTAVDRSGNESVRSVVQSAAVAANVDMTEITDRLDAAAITLTNVGAESLKTGAVLTSKLADNAVSQAKLQDQIVSLAKMDTTANAKIQQGVDDAAAAAAAAGAADGKAGTAQAAANAAQAAADAAAEAAITGAAYSLNPSFDDWTGTLPAKFGVFGTGPTKATDIVKRGDVSARFNVTTAADYGFNWAGILDHAPNLEYFTIEVQFYLASGNLSGAAVLLDWVGLSPYRAQINLKDEFPTPQTGRWYTLVKTVRRPVGATGTWAVMDGYLMANYSAAGGYANKDIYFDWLNVRPASVEEVQSYGAPSLISAAQAAANAAQARADAAFADAGSALTAAGNAQSSANGKNNVYYLAALPSGTGFADGDTVFIRSAVGQPITAQWRWDKPTNTWKAETLSHQVIASLDMGKASVGELDGVFVKAKTLRAEHLRISDFADFAPSLAESPGDWTFTGGMIDSPTSLDASGRRPGVADNTGTAYAIAPYKSVKPGDKLYGYTKIYRDGTSTHGMYCRFYWYDKDKVYLSYSNVESNSTVGNGGTLKGVVLVPGGAAYTRFQLLATASSGGAGFYNISGYKQSSSVLIEDGAVTADKVAADAITARHLVVGDFANLAIGSDFEDANAIPWALHSNHARTTSQKKSGAYSLRLAPAASTSQSTLVADTTVKEGEQWYVKAWAYIDSGFNGSSGGSKIRVGNQSGTYITAAEFATQAKSSWQQIEAVATIPAGATAMQITINSDHTAGYAYLDDIQVRRMSEASLIQNLGVEKLTASTAGIGTAVIDKLWAEVVRSRSITTDMLSVGRGDNLIAWNVKNVPSSYAPHHILGGHTAQFMTDAAHSGKTSLYLTGGSWTAGTWTQVFRFNSGFTADNGNLNHWNSVQGQKMVLEGWFRLGGSWGTPYGKTRFQVAYSKADGSFHSLVYSSELATDFTWQKLSFEFEPPSAAASIYVYVQMDRPGGLRMDDPFMAPQYQASLISEGAIVAPHLTVTEEMWAKIIRFKKLEGNEIDVNALTSDTGWIGTLRGGVLINNSVDTGVLKADAITSKHTLTGAKIQTSASTNRGIKLEGSILRAWTATGVETFKLDGGDGSLTATGRFRTGTSGNYIDVLADGNGGQARFYTGNGTGRGSIWARDDVTDGPKMSIAYSNLDEPSGTLPVVVVTPTKAYMRYGSRAVQVWNNGGSEELLLDATGAAVVLRGNLDMRSGDSRTQYRYQGASATSLGYVGQRPESGTSADFEVRADVGGVRLSGSSVSAFSIFNNSTGSAANVYVDSSGKLWKASSAARYKTDRRELVPPRSLLDIPLVDWVDRAQVEAAEALAGAPRPFNAKEQAEADAINLRRKPGVIAEEVEAAGGEQFVEYGPDGATEGVMYPQLALAQIQLLKDRVADLAALVEPTKKKGKA